MRKCEGESDDDLEPKLRFSHNHEEGENEPAHDEPKRVEQGDKALFTSRIELGSLPGVLQVTDFESIVHYAIARLKVIIAEVVGMATVESHDKDRQAAYLHGHDDRENVVIHHCEGLELIGVPV